MRLKEMLEFVLFVVRGTCIALADFFVMYTRVGFVWWSRQDRKPSMEQRDLVVQLAPTSPYNSRVSAADLEVHVNWSFVDRGLWRILSSYTAAPSALVTGVSYGGIGFYTALLLALCGVDVHGVVRSPARAAEANDMFHLAINRLASPANQRQGKVGRITLRLCDMSDTEAVRRLADEVDSDANLRVVVSNAGPMCSPLQLSPQHLEEQFATHCVGHGLLILRLLQLRLARKQRDPALDLPPCRFIILSSAAAATAHPTELTTFRRWRDVRELSGHGSRYGGYGNAKMCELLFAFALARFIRGSSTLAPVVTANVLHPGPIRSRVIPNSKLPLKAVLDGEMAGLFRMTPVIAAMYVADLALGRRHKETSGHFFRMGEDQTNYYARMVSGASHRDGYWLNSTAFPGIPGPAVSLSKEKQQWLWGSMLDYFAEERLIDPSYFQ